MSAADYLPKNRREVGAVLLGASLSFGISAIPGVTIESSDLTDCRAVRLVLESAVATAAEASAARAADHADAVEGLEERVARCWARFREHDAAAGHGPAPAPTGTF